MNQIKITASNIRNIPVITRTGKDFGFLVMATVFCKDGSVHDVLYDKEGELIMQHELLEDLESYYNKAFKPGIIDGEKCLVSIDTVGSNHIFSNKSACNTLIFNEY
jgi:hypothetical protein